MKDYERKLFVRLLVSAVMRLPPWPKSEFELFDVAHHWNCTSKRWEGEHGGRWDIWTFHWLSRCFWPFVCFFPCVFEDAFDLCLWTNQTIYIEILLFCCNRRQRRKRETPEFREFNKFKSFSEAEKLEVKAMAENAAPQPVLDATFAI